MSTVLIPYGGDASKVAQDLLAAAEALDIDPVHAVRNQPDDGGFRVPEEVAAKAGYGEPDEPETSEEADSEPEEKPKPAKRTAKKTAKKAPAKKTASKE